MRAEVWVFAALAAGFGCATNLEDENAPRAEPGGSVATVQGCLPLSSSAQAVLGNLSIVQTSSDQQWLLASSADRSGLIGPTLFALPEPSNCFADSTRAIAPAIDASPLGAGMVARPLASLSSDPAITFFEAVRASDGGSEGFGVARWSGAREQFVAVNLLWTADRPRYGSSVLRSEQHLYVFGGLPARFLAADVYLARVDPSQVTVADAYEYWQGGGNWGRLPDTAVPLVEAAVEPSVAFSAARNRWVMVYATPYAREITVRTGLAPAGPWSRPVTVARCDLPAVDPEAFCGQLAILNELSGAQNLWISQAVGTVSAPEEANARDYWTRLVELPWSEDLP